MLSPEDILYYVFDEAHYFLTDAPFNANTNYWYSKDFSKSITIFLTATPEPLYCFLSSFTGCPIYKHDFFASKIYEQYTKRRTLRRNMQAPKKELYITPGSGEGPSIEFYSQKEIDQECRSIKPYKEAFDFISSAIQQIQGVPQYHFYTQDTDYSYVCPFYFNELCDLVSAISDSPDKWLIFVESKEEGNKLLGHLLERGCSTVYLSSDSKKTKNSDSYQEFVNIVERQRFDCHVLIATSVLDCGVSIVDQQVKNIVICNPDRTEFLQMLGRRRVKSNESINLYMKAFTPTRINHLRSIYERELNFCSKLILINSSSYVKAGDPTPYWDGMSQRSHLPAAEMNDLVKRIPQYPHLIYNRNQMVYAERGEYAAIKTLESTRDLLLKEYEVNRSAFVFLMYRLKNCIEAMDVHISTEDPLFYLKRQLSWIQKQYRENELNRWVGYNEALSSFITFLEEERQEGGILKDEQDEFCRECLEYIFRFPMPIEAIKKDISRYKSGKALPKKNKLNVIFRELELPYKVISKQLASGDRKTIWFIVHTDE